MKRLKRFKGKLKGYIELRESKSIFFVLIPIVYFTLIIGCVLGGIICIKGEVFGITEIDAIIFKIKTTNLGIGITALTIIGLIYVTKYFNNTIEKISKN